MTKKKLIRIFKYILQNNEKFLFKMLAKIILTQSQVLQIVMQNMPPLSSYAVLPPEHELLKICFLLEDPEKELV